MSAAASDRGAWRLVVAPLLVSRVLWLATVLAVLHATMPGAPLLTGIRTSLTYWDAMSYLDLASSGYATHLDYHDAFLPGYPLLVGAAALFTRDGVVGGWAVSLAAEAVALWYIARLVLAERDRDSAALSVWLVALAPAALFFTGLYTESPFVAAAAASLYHARQGNTRAASVAAAIACSIRLTGLALLPAIALEHFWRRRARRNSQALYLVLIPLPLLLFCAYMQLRTHNAFAYFDAQRLPSFDHTAAPPWQGFSSTWNTMATASDGETRSIFAREVAFGLLGLVLCAAMWAARRIPRSLAVYCTLAWLLTSSLTFWRSEPRYDLALFPAVLLIADLTARARAIRPAVVVLSAALMCAGISIYAQGRWLG